MLKKVSLKSRLNQNQLNKCSSMVELINKAADVQLPFYKKSPTIFFHQEFLSLECFCFGLIYRAFQSVDILIKRNLIQKNV